MSRIVKYNQAYHFTHIFSAGDTVQLASEGHGFEALDDFEIIELKQEPYAGTRFEEKNGPA